MLKGKTVLLGVTGGIAAYKFMGYTRGIRGVFMGYTYVSGMCRVCIGYVSGKCRRRRGGRGEYIYSSDKKY